MNRASLNTFLSGMMMLFLVFSAPAQNTSSSFSQSLSFSAALHYGFSNPANIKLESIQNSRSFLEELDISSQTTGQKIWQQQAGYPIIGLSFLFGQRFFQTGLAFRHRSRLGSETIQSAKQLSRPGHWQSPERLRQPATFFNPENLAKNFN